MVESFRPHDAIAAASAKCSLWCVFFHYYVFNNYPMVCGFRIWMKMGAGLQNSQDFAPGSNTTVTFLTWLEGKKIQEKQDKLQHRLRQIELEELEKKHTRQDAQQAYKRWEGNSPQNLVKFLQTSPKNVNTPRIEEHRKKVYGRNKWKLRWRRRDESWSFEAEEELNHNCFFSPKLGGSARRR